MARKKKAVAGVISDTTYYFDEKGQIVDENGAPAPPAFAKAITAGGIKPPEPAPPKPEKPPKPPKPPKQPRQPKVKQTLPNVQPPAASSNQQPPAQETPKQGLGALNEKVAKKQGFMGSALESAAESEYNQKDAASGRKALGSIAERFIARPARGIGRVAKDATSALMATDYVGLGALSPAAFELYGNARGKKGGGGIGGGRAGSPVGAKLGDGTISGKNSSTESIDILKEILTNIKNVSETISNANENIKAVNTSLDRQNTDAIDDRRNIRQQNEQIIRLLEIIANKSSGGGGGAGPGGPQGPGMLDRLKSSLLGALPFAGKALKGAYNLAKAGVKGVVGGAKILGRGVMKGAGLLAGGVSSLFGGGAKAAEKGGAKIAEKGAASAAEVAAKTAEKEAPKAAAATGKAAESIIAKEGAGAAEKGAVKAAGKSGLKEIVAKVIGPRVAKVVTKSLPVVGALAGLGFGIARAMEGDFKGAAAEVGSGAASMFPGVGTAASIATDVGLLARDVYKEAYGIFPEDDPKSGERIDEVKKEVTDYITGAQQAESKETPPSTPSTPGVAPPAAPATGGDNGGASQGTGAPGANLSTPSLSPLPALSADNLGAGDAAAKNFQFNQQSAGMATQGAVGAATIINNSTVNNNSGGGGGKGASPDRASGTPSSAPVQSNLDMILYGTLYGAGYP